MEQAKRRRNSQGQTNQLGAVFEAMADAVIVYDAKGRIARLNDAASTLLRMEERRTYLSLPVDERDSGLEMRDMEGRPLKREQRPAIRVLHGERLAAETAPDIRVRTPDGRDLVLNISGAPLHDASGQLAGAVCVVHDVTERWRLEQEIAERAAELESIFATQAEGVVYADSTGRILRMNEAQRQLLAARGIDPAVEHIDEWAATSAPRDAQGQPVPRERLPFYRALRGETVTGEQAVELYQRAQDGQNLALRISAAPVRDTQGTILGAVLTTYDVTQQRRLERELIERASQIESMFDAMADGVVMCDVTGRIVRMNAAHRQLLGYDITHETAANHLEDKADRYAPRDTQNRPLPKEDWPINRILRGETLTGAQAVEMRLRTLDGRELSVQVSGAPVRDAAGRIIGAVSATRDITERRQLEQQRNDIFRVVAHDLMNPITGVRLYLHTQRSRLLKGQPPFMPDDNLWDMMDANLTRMEYLVNDLRAVASIESGALSLERRPCDLTALCQREIAIQQALAPGRVIQFIAPDESILAEVDEQRVGQVTANLLSNALKYSPAERPITLTLSVDDETARLAVKDAGPGIPPQELDHIWEQFHRIEGIKALDGTQSLGLGLYICRAIVERHGGLIGVESTVGAGSTFWFRLPLAAPATDAGNARAE